MPSWGKTPEGFLTSNVRCKPPKYIDPNFYNRNRYGAKGTTILYDKANHITICRRGQPSVAQQEKHNVWPPFSEQYYCVQSRGLSETLPCTRIFSTTNPSLKPNNRYPVRDAVIDTAVENQYCHGRNRKDSFGICYRKNCVPGVLDEKKTEVLDKIKKLEDDLTRARLVLDTIHHHQRSPPVPCDKSKPPDPDDRTGANRLVHNYHT